MQIMNERPADKLWKDMTSEEVQHFFKLLAKRAENQADLAYKTTIELAKYLFATNTGAAAGVFLLLKSKPDQFWYLVAFFVFCGGTFFVGVCYLTFANRSRKLAHGSVQDIHEWGRNELTVADVDAKNRKRYAALEKAWVFLGLMISFILLMIGGLIAGFSLWYSPH
jgi:hypothetical protein